MALLLVAEQQETARTQKSGDAWWSDEINRLTRTGAASHARWIAEVSTGEVPDSDDIEIWFQDGLKRIIAGLSDEGANGSAPGLARDFSVEFINREYTLARSSPELGSRSCLWSPF
ncbi:hypothetical protein [Garicola koreensis]|uniref:Uncharacterized protein n=1 Tax=Garicola koreensis TaxID=1262554 RepID=A0A7W5XZT7_9MICC|nr:hypothetical protein [Garicola koreensis]MBB3666533.1 hypothetical protein [Garicola koreensis]